MFDEDPVSRYLSRMSPIYSCESISDILTSIFDFRKNKNPHYSIRAFARDLEMSPSRLSELMNNIGGGISGSLATKMSNNLKLKPQEKKFFLDTILATSARNRQVRKLASKRIEKAKKSKLLLELQEEQFKIISDWYHAAILELTQIDSFHKSPDWIAQTLGISEVQAKEAVTRLKKVGLIQVRSDGAWEIHPDAYQTFSKSSLAVRKFHQQIMSMAAQSIAHDPALERECQAMIVAIPKKSLPKFSEKMRDFLRDCWEDIGDDEKDSLYSFSVQLTPARQILQEKQK